MKGIQCLQQDGETHIYVPSLFKFLILTVLVLIRIFIETSVNEV